jgi:uncharacterized protein YcbK (DUF882 family)
MPGTAAALGADSEPSAPAAPRLTRRALLSGAGGMVLVAALHTAAAAAPSGERRLALYNPHTDERFDDVYWSDGTYVATSLQRVNWLMRDFHQEKVAAIDPQLLDLLQRLAGLVETDGPFDVLSGYRTAATNRLLRREGLAPAAPGRAVTAMRRRRHLLA